MSQITLTNRSGSKNSRDAKAEKAATFQMADLISSVAWALLVALCAAMSAGEIFWLGSDISGVLFLLIAILYRGSSRGWWLIHAPIGLLLLFIPVARWEIADLLSTTGLMRASLVPGLSFVGSCLIATLHETLTRSIEGADELARLRAQSYQKLRNLKDMEIEMKEIIRNLSKAPIPAAKPSDDPVTDLAWQTVEFSSAEGPMSSQAESDSMTYAQIQNLLSQETDRASRLATNAKLYMSSPTDLSIPLAMRGRLETLQTLIRGLVESALDSLVGNGVIRLTLSPGLRSLVICLEDNGRGLNEALVLKLEAKGLMTKAEARLSWSELKALAEACGWTLELQARLGVGSRVTLELPRVDAFAYGARMQHTREMRGSLNALTELDASSQPG